MANILREIEAEYPVDQILVDGNQIWPYLRVIYYLEYYYGNPTCSSGQPIRARHWGGRLGHLAGRVRQCSYGLTNWAGRYDYVAFSDTTERKEINGKYYNKLLDPIIDELGGERVLYVETPAPVLYPIRRVHTRRVVSRSALELLWSLELASPTALKRGYEIQNLPVLQTIQRRYGFTVDDRRQIAALAAQRRVFGGLFRHVRPKAIFLSDYAGQVAAIKAARDLGIKVIEVQHGHMGKEHELYNIYTRNIDRTYFPDFMLVFGEEEREAFEDSLFIAPENVYPVGNFYIGHIVETYRPESRLVGELSSYKRRVGVTLQWTVEARLIEFICRAATLDRTICYLMIPRAPRGEGSSAHSLPDNVRFVTDKNFYQLMSYVDFHSTVYSTCALEAPSLGVQNVLINIDGDARRYYGSTLTEPRVTQYADTPEQYVGILNAFNKLDRDEIRRLNEGFIAPNYRQNIRDFIGKHLGS